MSSEAAADLKRLTVTSQISLQQNEVAARYDISTYMGRLRKFLDLTSPQHLFRTESDIKACQKTLQLAANGAM